MSTRRRPVLLTLLLAVLLVLSGPGLAGAGHARASGTAGLTAVVVCGDTGPRTIHVDAAGNPDGHEDGDRTCCDGVCAVCAAAADHAAVLADGFASWPIRSGAAARPVGRTAAEGRRPGGPRARAPPEDRS